MTTFLGCDPGGRETGLIVRRRDDLLAHSVVIRQDTLTMPDGAYCRQVAAEALRLLEKVGSHPRDPELVVCVEGVRYWPKDEQKTKDGKRKKPPNLTGLLGTAIVLGSIVARWPDAIVVRPGSKHGGLAQWVYPPQIQQTGVKGKDLMRHCRSGWDASYHGQTLWNQRRGEPA